MLVDKFQSKNQIRTKIAVEIIVLILSIAVFIVGGIMVTANSAGQISAALKLPMQVYYVCIPISGCEIIVLILSIAVFIVGGIMVTANSAGQISAALKLPMQVYYVCIPISGCLMVLYCLERLKRWFTELKEGK